jgi:hypothetical protein
MNANGTGVTRLTTDPADDSGAAWSPNGAKIAFASQRDGNSEIYVMNADGSGQTRLTNNAATDTHPGWSPEGSRIVFSSDRDGNREIYVMNADGTAQTRVTNDPSFDIQPVWSPDGTKIAFVTNRNNPAGDFHVWTMNANGTGASPLPGAGDDDHSPDWSPTAEKVAFSSYLSIEGCASPGSINLFTINADGSGLRRINAEPSGSDYFCFYESPAWSPDGRKIAAAFFDVFTFSSNGGGREQITTGQGFGALDWQPLRGLDPYPRPGGGTPLFLYLTPAYRQCATASQNSNHVAPLALDSCSPPWLESGVLTTSTIGKGLAFARLDVFCTDGATPPCNPADGVDEEDVRIQAYASDVRCDAVTPGCPAQGADYSGQVVLTTPIRITDRASGFGGVSATVSDTELSVPFSCSPTDDTTRGSTCMLDTTADTVVPGFAREGKRAVISTPTFAIEDAGPDGSLSPSSGACPPICGSGDESVAWQQGLFVP